MSLVVCSNKEQDGSSLRQDQSIYSAWSFRNSLPSTMKLPPHSQVALQSCKVNVDGRVVFSRNNHRFYQWFGEILDRDGTPPQIKDTTSYPAITTMTLDEESGQVIEKSLDDFAERLQAVLRSSSYHPNMKDKAQVEVLRNASGLDFLGYKIEFDQSTPAGNSIPTDNGFENWFRVDQDDGIFSYAGGVFKRETTKDADRCAGIARAKPFSLNNGSFIVNISGAGANANASGVEWHVGLSRYINNPSDGYRVPDYNEWIDDDDIDTNEDGFMDFAIARNWRGQLVVYHNAFDPDTADGKSIRRHEIEYWNNASAHPNFAGSDRINLDGEPFTKVGFFSEGERLKVSLYNSSDAQWQDVVQYTGTANANTYFKPVNQACWCLHPVLCVGSDDTDKHCTLKIEEFTAVPLLDYDPTTPNKGGWFETLELLTPGTYRCQELETTRIWSDPNVDGGYVQKGLNASGGTNLKHVLILEQSSLYAPTYGANARQIMGFSNSILDSPNSITGNRVIYQSDIVPNLTSSMAMFVRLNNFGQSVYNAHTGNRSKIIAHLPRFDNTQSTGRLYFEPNNLIWIDLQNPSEMSINEFDISFSYVNEQYATVLTGQSIVCLYFRQSPDFNR